MSGEPRPKSGKKPKKPRKPPELIESEAIVRARSGGICEAKTPKCEGRATQAHHVAGRTDHRPESLLDVCGMGNATGCHGYIHQHPDESRARGWMVSRLAVTSGYDDGDISERSRRDDAPAGERSGEMALVAPAASTEQETRP